MLTNLIAYFIFIILISRVFSLFLVIHCYWLLHCWALSSQERHFTVLVHVTLKLETKVTSKFKPNSVTYHINYQVSTLVQTQHLIFILSYEKNGVVWGCCPNRCCSLTLSASVFLGVVWSRPVSSTSSCTSPWLSTVGSWGTQTVAQRALSLSSPLNPRGHAVTEKTQLKLDISAWGNKLLEICSHTVAISSSWPWYWLWHFYGHVMWYSPHHAVRILLNVIIINIVHICYHDNKNKYYA